MVEGAVRGFHHVVIIWYGFQGFVAFSTAGIFIDKHCEDAVFCAAAGAWNDGGLRLDRLPAFATFGVFLEPGPGDSVIGSATGAFDKDGILICGLVHAVYTRMRIHPEKDISGRALIA